MILLFVHHLDRLIRNSADFDPKITAEIQVSLNGRPFRELVDPNLDLSEIPTYQPSYQWIKPFREHWLIQEKYNRMEKCPFNVLPCKLWNSSKVPIFFINSCLKLNKNVQVPSNLLHGTLLVAPWHIFFFVYSLTAKHTFVLTIRKKGIMCLVIIPSLLKFILHRQE